jgi:hypothetical protein
MSHPNPPVTAPNAPAVPGGAAGMAVPVPAPVGPRERRVRFGHLALAIALVVVGALGTTTLVALVAADGEYLALAQDVDYGARITDADLVVVRMSNPQGINPVAAQHRARVVGNYATMPLAAGTLLVERHVTDVPHPAAGEVRLGISLRNDRLPAQPVRPGQLLLLVETGNSGGSGADDRPRAARTWEAVVVGVSGEGSGSGLLGGGSSRLATLDVIVPARDAPVIAALAADNDLSVAVLPGQPEG